MGTVYTKSVYNVSVTVKDYGPYCNGNGVYQKCIQRFCYSKRGRNSTMDIVMGTVYTKSVYNVSVTVKEAEIQLWTLL